MLTSRSSRWTLKIGIKNTRNGKLILDKEDWKAESLHRNGA
jgi:hypothetical protein